MENILFHEVKERLIERIKEDGYVIGEKEDQYELIQEFLAVRSETSFAGVEISPLLEESKMIPAVALKPRGRSSQIVLLELPDLLPELFFVPYEKPLELRIGGFVYKRVKQA